jgi:hypothetical protein
MSKFLYAAQQIRLRLFAIDPKNKGFGIIAPGSHFALAARKKSPAAMLRGDR